MGMFSHEEFEGAKNIVDAISKRIAEELNKAEMDALMYGHGYVRYSIDGQWQHIPWKDVHITGEEKPEVIA